MEKRAELLFLRKRRGGTGKKERACRRRRSLGFFGKSAAGFSMRRRRHKSERCVTERRRFRKQGEECHSLCFVRAAGRLSNESAGMASDDVNALSCREKKRAVCRKRRDGPEKDVFRLSENHSAYWLLLGRNGVVIALLVGGGSVFHLRRTAAVR